MSSLALQFFGVRYLHAFQCRVISHLGVLSIFSCTTGGTKFVLNRLTYFLVTAMIILMAFAMIFSTLFRQMSQCAGVQTNPYSAVIEGQWEYPAYSAMIDDQGESPATCEPEIDQPFCSYITGLTKMMNMLTGEVNDAGFAFS